jgi:hypothetical protein
VKVIKMSNISTLQWQNLWTQIYKHLYKQPLWQNMCLRFAMWTKAKSTSRWCNDLLDEGLRGFGLVESAKTLDKWSSWSFEGTSIFLLCVSYFLVLFFVCKWWALFCILHGMGGGQRWSMWNVCCIWTGSLIENNASIRRSFQFGEAKFYAN